MASPRLLICSSVLDTDATLFNKLHTLISLGCLAQHTRFGKLYTVFQASGLRRLYTRWQARHSLFENSMHSFGIHTLWQTPDTLFGKLYTLFCNKLHTLFQEITTHTLFWTSHVHCVGNALHTHSFGSSFIHSFGTSFIHSFRKALHTLSFGLALYTPSRQALYILLDSSTRSLRYSWDILRTLFRQALDTHFDMLSSAN